MNASICRFCASAPGSLDKGFRGLQALPPRTSGLETEPGRFPKQEKYMGWLSAALGKYEVKRDPIATAEDLRSVFEQEHDHLDWIALVITSDRAMAHRCLVDASGLSANRAGVFRDWLLTWSRSATARIASDAVREAISASALQYANKTCDHANHPLLSEKEIDSVRRLDPLAVISELDAISRAVLVLRGIQGASIAACSLQLKVPRKCVVAAYCNALRWFCEKTHGVGSCGSHVDPYWEILDGEE